MKTPNSTKTNTRSHYCNKAEMLEELRQYKKTGVISEKLGAMFLEIAKRYSSKPCFYNYPDRMDWISSSVLRMIEKIDKFDVNHSKANPFFYFTRIVQRKIFAEITKVRKRVAISNQLTQMSLDKYEARVGARKNKRGES